MPYTVRGRVRRVDNGQGIGGLTVRAYDVDWISADDFLGSNVTDSNGYFRINFTEDAFDAGWWDIEGGPDIVVKVYNSHGRLLYTSEERSGAGEDTYFDIRLNSLDLLGEYTVGGTVRDGHSLSRRVLCNLVVEAKDDDFIFDDLLGSDRTNHQGQYMIAFTPESFEDLGEGNPDVYVRVRNDAGLELVRSSTREETGRHTTIDVEVRGVEVERSMSECIYDWDARYRQMGTHIVIRIELDPDSGITDAEMSTLRNRWKQGIENKWSNHFACCCETAATRISQCSNPGTLTFEVVWTDEDSHHTVSVHRGSGRADMTNWYTTDSGDVASHEFGHMLGLVDEYPDAHCPSRSPVNTGTVMHDLTEVVERQVEQFCRMLNENAVLL